MWNETSAYRVSRYKYPAGGRFPGEPRGVERVMSSEENASIFSDQTHSRSAGQHCQLPEGRYLFEVLGNEGVVLFLMWYLDPLLKSQGKRSGIFALCMPKLGGLHHESRWRACEQCRSSQDRSDKVIEHDRRPTRSELLHTQAVMNPPWTTDSRTDRHEPSTYRPPRAGRRLLALSSPVANSHRPSGHSQRWWIL